MARSMGVEPNWASMEVDSELREWRTLTEEAIYSTVTMTVTGNKEEQ